VLLVERRPALDAQIRPEQSLRLRVDGVVHRDPEPVCANQSRDSERHAAAVEAEPAHRCACLAPEHAAYEARVHAIGSSDAMRPASS
jgi:hypothetical protein